MPTISSYGHETMTDDQLHPAVRYNRTTDPTTDSDPNPGDLWINESSGELKIRNTTDTAWLGPFGSGTVLTTEQVQDIVAALTVAGTGITVTYNDGANTLTIALSSHTHTASDITDFTEASQDVVGAMMTDSTSIDAVYDDSTGTVTLSVILEWLQDTVAAMLTGGSHTNLTATYQDASGVIDLAASGGGGYTDPLTTKGDLVVRTITTTVRFAVGTNGQKIVADSAQTPGIKWADDISTLNFIIDGGGSAITTGIKGDLVVDFPCTIVGHTLLADQSGSIVIDVWKDTYANFPPVVGDTITASAKPTLSTATKAQDTTLTGWTTSITAGDILRFNVDSVTTVTRVTLALKVKKL